MKKIACLLVLCSVGTAAQESSQPAAASREELQELACAAWDPEPSRHLVAFGRIEQTPLRYGGWYGIRVLDRALDLDKEFDAWVKKNRKQIAPDYVLDYPSFWAIAALIRTIQSPDKPRFEIGVPRAKRIAEWKEWIKANGESLAKLEPKGDGVDFSTGACKKRKKTG